MEPILIIGIIIVTGFLLGELAARWGLPGITGYMLAGVLLNPGLTHFIPASFIQHTDPITRMALSFITFSVGGSVLFSTIRSLGKRILLITLCEAEIAFLAILAAFTFLGPLLIARPEASLVVFFLPLSLLLASLAVPTDPSAVLAVKHEYQAKGDVTATIMSVAAFDDILGIINFSLGMTVAGLLVMKEPLSVMSFLQPFFVIAGSIVLGTVFGLILNGITRLIQNDNEGTLIVVVFGLLALCYGVAETLNLEALLTTMTMGIIVTNYNMQREKVFQVLERYTETLILVLFFTISVMHLNFSVLAANYLLIFIFVVFRALGKVGGTMLGAAISGAPTPVRRYTAGGLLPQGGIVIGLALIMRQNPAFAEISPIVINVIIGATIIHELSGPVIAKAALKKAGDLSSGPPSV